MAFRTFFVMHMICDNMNTNEIVMKQQVFFTLSVKAIKMAKRQSTNFIFFVRMSPLLAFSVCATSNVFLCIKNIFETRWFHCCWEGWFCKQSLFSSLTVMKLKAQKNIKHDMHEWKLINFNPVNNFHLSTTSHMELHPAFCSYQSVLNVILLVCPPPPKETTMMATLYNQAHCKGPTNQSKSKHL